MAEKLTSLDLLPRTPPSLAPGDPDHRYLLACLIRPIGHYSVLG